MVGVDSFANLELSVVCAQCATFLPRCVAKADLCIGRSSPLCWDGPSLLFSGRGPTAGVGFLSDREGQLAPSAIGYRGAL